MIVYSTDNERTDHHVQTFDYLVPQFRLNKSTDELVQDENPLDLDAFIQSSLSTALNMRLADIDRASGVEDEGVVQAISELQDKLDVYRSAYADKVDFSEKYGLAANLTFEQYYSELSKIYDKAIKFNTESEVVNNEKNNVPLAE